MHAWNSYQTTENVPLILPTTFDQTYDYDNHIVEFINGAYNTQFPLDVVIDPTQDFLNNSSNLDPGKLFKQRLTSKYLMLRLEYNEVPGKQLSLSYISYNFRKALR